MMKKGSSPFSLWKKYYFVLDGRLLMYYRSGNDYKELAGAKGSLDLTVLEDVRIKKAGRMKPHFPFSLSRRNLKTINLATETEEERKKWMGVMRGTMGHPSRLSGSEDVLTTSNSSTTEAKEKKYATLPPRTPNSHSVDSSSESEEEKEEEPILIQPKKVVRMGTVINMDLSAVKLKKVDSKKQVEEKKETDSKDKSECVEKFGIILRKPSERTTIKETCGDRKKDAKATEGSDNEATVKKPLKQPNIPLNKSPLLSQADIETNRISPDSKGLNTIDRKRSPSPSIPLSKNVHAFVTKSNDDNQKSDSKISSEEIKIKDVPVFIAQSNEIRFSDDALSMDDTPVVEYVQVEEKLISSGDNVQVEEKLISPVGDNVQVEAKQISSEGDNVQVEEKLISSEGDNVDGDERKAAEVLDSEKSKEAVVIPQVSIIVKDYSDEEAEYEEFDEEFLHTMQQNKTAELTNRESGKFSADKSAMQPTQSNLDEDNKSGSTDLSKSSDEEVCDEVYKEGSVITERDEHISEKQPQICQPKNTEENNCVVQKSESSGDKQQDNEEIDEELQKNVTTAHRLSTSNMKDSSAEVLTIPSLRLTGPEGGETLPCSPLRIRTLTNESSNSSCKSDSENPEKKFGKFKIFQSKRQSSCDEDKINDDVKDPKERKRKKSSFSKFLPGKKNKDRKSKSDEDFKRPKSESSPSLPEKHQCNEPLRTKLDENESKESTDSHCTTDINKETEMPELLQVMEEDTTDTENLKQIELRHNQLSIKDESRCSTYSRSSTKSHEADSPPSVPEKMGMRSNSPFHDVPQSNQPVSLVAPSTYEMKEQQKDRKVDGMITQEQINAILSARDTREKKRKSSNRGSVGLLSNDSSGNETTEEIISRRPSKISVTSTESDEPLPKTNFLNSDRHSSSSGILKNQRKSDESDASSDTQTIPLKNVENSFEQEQVVVLRKPSRLTEGLVSVNRISLTSPEFTVMEEDAPGTPDFKTKPEAGSEDAPDMEEDEQNDYFPVIGGGIELRNPSPSRLIPDQPGAGMRTSGITGLKAFLDENQEDLTDVKSGISRLGHSVAVEQLKRESTKNS